MPEDRTYYDTMIKEYDLPVPMRDGVNLRVDVYRPDAPGTFPVLYTCAMHNKDLQRVEVAENLKVGQPAWSHPVVRRHRGRRLQALRGQRLRARDRPGAGRPQVGGRARS